MFVKDSVIAGEILNYLEEVQRSASLTEIVYFLEHPLYNIQLAVKRLVDDELVVLDVDNETVKLVKIPDYIESKSNHIQTNRAKSLALN